MSRKETFATLTHSSPDHNVPKLIDFCDPTLNVNLKVCEVSSSPYWKASITKERRHPSCRHIDLTRQALERR